MLTIAVVTILGNGSLLGGGHDWAPGKGNDPWNKGGGHSTRPLHHVIQGTKSGKYLCMDDESAPYHRDFVSIL